MKDTGIQAGYRRDTLSQKDTGILALLGKGDPSIPHPHPASLAGLMQSGRRYTFEELTTVAEDAGLFERITVDRDNEGGLSRRAKKQLSGILGKFDRRRVTASGIFRMEGKGHSRRYSLHGPHGPHGVSPQQEKGHFPIRPEYHADHADHAQRELISQEGRP